ncbi:MAG: protein-tyrosine phosphatase family protein [Gemmobacter sp.]
MDRVAATAGWIGLVSCPGRAGPGALVRDLAAIANAGARHLVTLLPSDEMHRLGVPGLGAAASEAGLRWWHLPIRDFTAPDDDFENAWAEAGFALRAALAGGEGVVIHCRAGVGRTGTVAARLLVELGETPDAAIAAVRRARPGTIETVAQEAHVRAASPKPR